MTQRRLPAPGARSNRKLESFGKSAMTTSIINCTVVDNDGGLLGGGVTDFGGTSYLNTIVWSNVASVSDPQIWGTPASIEYSDVEDGSYGGTNLDDVDPEFVDALNGDYRLSCDSDCVDEGDPD